MYSKRVVHKQGEGGLLQSEQNKFKKDSEQQRPPPTLRVRTAEPRKFTQRAYPNRRLGVCKVEVFVDLITANTPSQRRQTLMQFNRRLGKLYSSWREELISASAHAESVIEFVKEEDLSFMDNDVVDKSKYVRCTDRQ